MASYKQNCIHCGTLIDRDTQFCPGCGSMSPFGYRCPDCMKEIVKGQQLCSECGRPLYTVCPYCGGRTFVMERCEVCQKSLMMPCPNKRCNALQFFENKKCTACGKIVKFKIKKAR